MSGAPPAAVASAEGPAAAPAGADAPAGPCEDPPAGPPAAPAAAAGAGGEARPPRLRVVVGTSEMARLDRGLAARIADVANRANGYQRFSEGEVRGRLAKGDAGRDANRVLHIALRGERVVGCCSSTLQVGWGAGGGHWGALAVDPAAQGTGVATALVAAAERRLLDHGCTSVQIEYHYHPGDADSERLRGWYEGKLGFRGSGSGFRCARKRLSESTVARLPAEDLQTGPSVVFGSGGASGNRLFAEEGAASEAARGGGCPGLQVRGPACSCLVL